MLKLFWKSKKLQKVFVYNIDIFLLLIQLLFLFSFKNIFDVQLANSLFQTRRTTDYIYISIYNLLRRIFFFFLKGVKLIA